jgi:hypothetical protein
LEEGVLHYTGNFKRVQELVFSVTILVRDLIQFAKDSDEFFFRNGVWTTFIERGAREQRHLIAQLLLVMWKVGFLV